MADTQEAIRRLSFQATTTGVTDATKQLNDLAKAQGGVAVASASTEKATLSLDQKFASIEKRYVAGVAAQAQYEKTQKLVNAAVAQNPALQDRANAILSAAKERHDQLANSQKALGVITGDLNSRVQAAAGSFGVVGQALSALGPAGLAAAAVIGTAAVGFNIASDAAHALAEKSKELREFAEATGLTTQQVQALKSEAGKFGIDSETLSGGIQKFTAGFQQLRLGTGDLLTQIRRINPALADQIQGAQDAATAFTLFGKAVSQTDNIFQRNALLKAGLGKGSAIFGEFFSSAPDVAGLTSAFAAAGKGLDDNLIKKLAQLQVEIDKTRGAASTIFASVFAEEVLQSEKAFATVLLDVAKAFKAISDFKFPTLNIPDVPDWVKTALSIAAKGLPIVGPAIGLASAAKDAVSAGASSYDSSFHGTSPANSYSTFQGGGAAGASAIAGVAQLTPDALAAKLKDLVAVLGSAASPAEKLKASIAELAIKARDAGVGADELARGVAGLKLDTAISVQSAHNAALGQAATVTDILKAKTLELAKAQQQGAGLTKDQVAFQMQYARENALGITQIKGQTDAENVRAATLLMSNQAAIAYTIVQSKINEARARGAPLTQAEIDDLQKEAAAYAQTKVATDRYADAIDTAKDAAKGFTKDLVSGLMQGKTGMEALASAATNLSAKLAEKALTDLFSGNFLQAGIEGIGAAVSYFVGKSAQKDAELEKAKKAWSDMKDQVVAFNNAAKGVNFGPITQAVQQLFQTQLTLATAAYKAQDYKGLANIQSTFNSGITRLVDSFVVGNPVLSDIEQKMKSVSDEGQGLIDVLQQLGLVTADGVARISGAIARQQAAIQAQADAAAAAEQAKAAADAAAEQAKAAADAAAQRENTQASMISDIRSNSGLGYLNTIADAVKKFNDALAQGVNEGVSVGWLASTAQTTINSAQLTGQAFQDLIVEFPELTNRVHEFIDTTALAAKAAADATQKLALQLRLLSATTDTSTQAGALTLFDAKAKQERDAAIAGGISPDNLVLLDQALAAERLGVIKGFTDQAVAAEKQLADARLAQMQRIQQYLDNLKGGSSSTLSPRDRLDAARSQYQTQLSLAQGGDANAMANITTYSDNFLSASRAYNASSDAFQKDLAYIQASLSSLMGAAGVSSGSLPSSSGIPGVSGVTSVPAAANTNSWAGVVDSVNSLKAEVVVLKTTLKASIDAGNASNAAGFTQEHEDATEANASLSAIKAQGALALASPR